MKTKKRQNLFLVQLLYHRVTITIVGLAVLVFISIPLARNASKQYKINNEINELESEIANLQSQNTELKKLMDYLESDQFIEEQARLNLSYKKPDESVVVVSPQPDEAILNGDNGATPGAGSNVAGGKLAASSNPANWLEYFFGKK